MNGKTADDHFAMIVQAMKNIDHSIRGA
jgi:hypothetical protein